MADGYNPFGEPDGARENIEDFDRIFVAFDDPRAWGGLATKPDDMAARFLVGRKGSGKTIHLRRQRAYAAASPDLYAAALEQSPPDSALIVRFAFRTKGHERTELWKLAWNKAILRATVSHLLAEPKLRDQLKLETRQRLAENYPDLLGPAGSQTHKIGVFAHMRSQLSHEWTYHEFDNYLHNQRWANVEEDLALALQETRRLCFYLDAVDEYYNAAPRYWLECQVGLFQAVMELLRDARFGGTLHVFVAFRDAVMLKVLQSEHGLRFFQERHVRSLDWDYKAIMLFLVQKILQLDKSLLAKPEAQDAVESWLGMRKRLVQTRRQEESLAQYLLRHTRFLPRDVIIQGNIICFEIARGRWLPELSTQNDPIREAVKQAAVGFGNELVSRCAGHILADSISDEAVRHSYESNYLDKTAGLFDVTRKTLIGLLQEHAEFERISSKTLLDIEQTGLALFGSNVDTLGALWLNGLLGYVDDDRSSCVVFYSHRHATELQIPTHKKTYAFHSSLIDSIGLKLRGAPVVPCP